MLLSKKFSDGTIIEYSKPDSKIQFRRYSIDGNLRMELFYDEHLKTMLKLAQYYSNKILWNDFRVIYNLTTHEFKSSIYELISKQSKSYSNHELMYDKVISLLYTEMVSKEQQRQIIKLGKKVRALGIHQVLFQNLSIKDVMNFRTNSDWNIIKAECDKFGIDERINSKIL